MTNVQIGAAGEAMAAAAFQRLGVAVYLPIGDAGVDLIADFGGRPQKIQVKTTSTTADRCTFQLGHRNSRGGRVGWQGYPAELVDYFALCSLRHGSVLLVPNDGRSTRNTRLSPGHPEELSAVVRRVQSEVSIRPDVKAADSEAQQCAHNAGVV